MKMNRVQHHDRGKLGHHKSLDQGKVSKYGSRTTPRHQILHGRRYARDRNYFPSQDQLWEECTLSTADLFWISEVKRGRTDLNNIASLGRGPDEDLTAIIAQKIDVDRHLSGRTLSQFLGIAAPTVCRYWTEVPGMKCHNLRWVPHALVAAQKVVCAEWV
jgi:hypothetical protein